MGEMLQRLNAERFQVIDTYYSVVNRICHKKRGLHFRKEKLGRIIWQKIQKEGFNSQER